MRCLDRHIPNNNTLEEKFGKPGEKSSDCRPNWWQTELKYDAFAGMELKPQGGGGGGGGGGGVELFLPLLHLCLGQGVERNPKCSLKSTFLLKSIMLRIPNLCSVKRKKKQYCSASHEVQLQCPFIPTILSSFLFFLKVQLANSFIWCIVQNFPTRHLLFWRQAHVW